MLKKIGLYLFGIVLLIIGNKAGGSNSSNSEKVNDMPADNTEKTSFGFDVIQAGDSTNLKSAKIEQDIPETASASE